MSVADLAWSIDCMPTVATTPKPKASWGKPAEPVARSLADAREIAEPMPAGSQVLRRWEAGFTDRNNAAHWEHAHGQPINHDLAIDLPTLRARTAWEISNNPIIEGMVNTHCTDLVGPDGPDLQVFSSDSAYNDRLEQYWGEWSERADVAGQMGLADILRLWVRGIWATGELLGQEVTSDDPSDTFPVSMRILPLHADRLSTPFDMTADQNVALGIRRTQNGRPTTYYLSKLQQYGPWQHTTGESIPVPADMIYHGFMPAEPGQVRGFPLLSSALPAIADLRDCDVQVLDAARAAADTGVWFYNLNPDGEKWAEESGIEIPYKRRTNRTAPPGWQPMQVTPGQPGPNYSEYRRERMVEFGRAAAIPLMMIRLDSSEHNYSSARFDHQVYIRTLEVWRSWIARRFLNRMVRVVARELQLARELPPMPRDAHFVWGWSQPPHVDPKKELDAERIGLQNRTLTFAEACHRDARSQEDVIASWARTLDLLKGAGFSDDQIAAFLAGMKFDTRPPVSPGATPAVSGAEQ